MKTSTQKRIARLSGLLTFALLVVALAVPAAQAMRDFSAGTGGPSTSAGSGTVSALQLPTLAQVQRAHYGHHGPSAVSGGGTVNAAQAASSGISSTVWIAAVAVLGTLLIGAWALARRRRQQREEAPACELSAAGC